MKKLSCLLLALALTAPHARAAHTDPTCHNDDEFWAYAILAAAAATVIGAVESWERVQPWREDGARSKNEHRFPGDPLIPFATVEGDLHYVDENTTSTSGAFELGYGPFAFRARHEKFTTESHTTPDLETDYTETTGLLRLSFGDKLELDLGGGEITIERHGIEEKETIFTTPLRANLTDWLALTFRPAWGRTLSIYDAALEPGLDFVRLRLGYRWTKTDTEEFSGPYLGASLLF